jgi:hypothetical protein
VNVRALLGDDVATVGFDSRSARFDDPDTGFDGGSFGDHDGDGSQ